jgi:hypothetical protein
MQFLVIEQFDISWLMAVAKLLFVKIKLKVKRSRGGLIVKCMQQFNFTKPQGINHYSIIPPLLLSDADLKEIQACLISSKQTCINQSNQPNHQVIFSED